MKKLIISVRGMALMLALVLGVGNVLLAMPPVSAAQLGSATVRLDRMAAGTNTTFRLLVKPATAGQTSISVNFNGTDTTTWTGSSGTVTGTTETDSSTQCTADGYTAMGGTHSFSTSTGSTITMTGITGLSSTTTTYCDDFTNSASLKTPTAGSYHPIVTVGSDSSTLSLYIVSNDQIIVTAVVPPTFSFSLGTNADQFSTNLASGSVNNTSGVLATVNTNARNGWIAWAKDANSGLLSATASKTIPSATAGSAASLSAGTEGYGVGASVTSQGSGGGTESVVSAYSGSYGGGLDGTLRQIISSNGTANTATFTVKEYAAISPTTPAANDYTDTITIVGAGSF